jgi:SNF2 family DNA or RNA helicase
LPEKCYYEKHVDLGLRQRLLYDTLRTELMIEIEDIEGNTILDDSNDILKKLLRLVQLASNPFLVDKSYNETPAKFIILDSIIEDIIQKGEKAIIWSSFVDNIRILSKRYKRYLPLLIYGDIPIERRNKSVNLFINDTNHKLLIANPAAAREGLTLTVANNAIYVDRNFNLVDYLQSQDRIHRISQERKCSIIKIIADGTIDVFIDEIISRKHSIASYIQGDRSDPIFDYNISKEQLLSYLS